MKIGEFKVGQSKVDAALSLPTNLPTQMCPVEVHGRYGYDPSIGI